jgi:hypothetical protein
MHVTDLLAPFAARWAQRVRRELDLVPHPLDTARQFVAGPDPDRVLVLGNGPAIGFGVLTQELSLPGHLARRLAAVTGRGASVDVAARRGVTAATAPALLGEFRMSRYDAVVLCIGSSDAYNLLSEERWRADLAQLLDTVRAATTPETVIAVPAIRPAQRPSAALGQAGSLVETHAARLDRIAEEVCARRHGVVHLTAGATMTEAPRTAEAYDRLASLLAPALGAQLDRLAARSAPTSARALRGQPDPEDARQAALDRTGLAAAGSSPRLDRLLRTARELFGVAGAAVTLVDGDRVLFKAAVGFEPQAVPRSVAPCDRVVRRRGAVVLGDLDVESMVADGWRFYAGHPLESPDGYRIGAVCLLDTRPHDPLTVDRVALAEVAARIEAQLWAEALATEPEHASRREHGTAPRPEEPVR